MIPYFTYDATRKHAGVSFEPVTRSGSQLFGTALVTPEQAIALQGNKFVKEISEDDYTLYEKKKALFAQSKSSFQMPDLTNSVLQRRAVAPVAKAVNSGFDAASVLAPRKVK
jgi:hypothetical protein